MLILHTPTIFQTAFFQFIFIPNGNESRLSVTEGNLIMHSSKFNEKFYPKTQHEENIFCDSFDNKCIYSFHAQAALYLSISIFNFNLFIFQKEN